MSDVDLTGLVLAGGRSRRMGQDKALLSFKGVPLLTRACQVALACTPQVWVVTRWPQRYQAIVPPEVRWFEEPAPADADGDGPMVALLHALRQVETPWVLVLACDMPNLEATVLQQWQAMLPALATDVVAYLPQSADRWEPLCGFYHRRSLPALEAFVQSGGRSFQRWLAQQPVAAVAQVPPGFLMNVNTPEAWAAWENAASDE